MRKSVSTVFRIAGGMRVPVVLIPLAVGVVAGVSGCASDECLGNKNSLPLAGFYSSAPVPEAVTIDSLTIYGVGAPGDSLLHDSVRSLSETYLPFRIDADSTVYVIKYLQKPLGYYGVADTITFRYDIDPVFVSVACGAMYDYHIRSISHTSYIIDSVTCPTGEITNLNSENIKIYFRVSQEE